MKSCKLALQGITCDVVCSIFNLQSAEYSLNYFRAPLKPVIFPSLKFVDKLREILAGGAKSAAVSLNDVACC